MSEENVEIVRRIYEAGARRDTETVLSLYDPDVEWDYTRGGVGVLLGPGIRQGHEGLRAWFRDWFEALDGCHSDYEELLEVGDRVVSVGTTGGIGRSSGAVVEISQAAVWTIRDGKVVRVVWFPTRSEALAAAGQETQAGDQETTSEELASVDGTIVATAEATITLRDDGLYRGDGAFEVIRLYAGRPFALTDHLDRLDRSAVAIELDYDRSALEREIEALLASFGAGDAQLRLIVTRGGRRLAMTEPLPPHGATLRIATVTYSPSVILNGVKSLSYAANMQASRIARSRGADEAVLVTPDGIVLEAPTSAVFWVPAAGGLRTPGTDLGVLESITRSRLLRELEVEEGAFDVEDLHSATEAFLASTTREVQPVSAIDGQPLHNAPGPLTQAASEAFAGLRDEELR